MGPEESAEQRGDETARAAAGDRAHLTAPGSIAELFGAGFFQLAWVTDNLDAGLAALRDRFGVARFAVEREVHLPEAVVRGEETEIVLDLALAAAGRTVIELIRPLSEPNVYDELMRPGAPATLHHIGVGVPDLAGRVARATQQGDAPVFAVTFRVSPRPPAHLRPGSGAGC